VIFHDDLLFSGSDDKTIRIWENFTEIRNISLYSAVLSIAVYQDKMWAGLENGYLCFFSDFEETSRKKLHEDCIWTLDQHSGALAIGSWDSKISIYEYGDVVATLNGHRGYVRCVKFG
jgi:hypothetical protein